MSERVRPIRMLGTVLIYGDLKQKLFVALGFKKFTLKESITRHNARGYLFHGEFGLFRKVLLFPCARFYNSLFYRGVKKITRFTIN